MRIVSGTLKGRRFSPPSSFKARPTTDQARESLFNVLNNLIDFETQNVLDLFSGTGAISYEFASRGCPRVISVEHNYRHFSFIKSCVQEFGLKAQINPVRTDAYKYLKQNTQQYSLIFADPPYDHPLLDTLPSIVASPTHLTPEGLFILEHGPDRNFQEHSCFWQLRKYGKVNFSFFRLPPTQ